MITENLGQKSDHHARDLMLDVFIEGTRHELKVFEEAVKT